MAPEVVVVGGGPAGLSAAVAAARAGAGVALLDERPAPGGQLRYRRAPLALEPDGAPRDPTALADRLAEAARAAGVEILANTTAWGVFDDLTLGVARDERAELLAPRVVVLATGSTDRPLPFPGWTTPGVFSARAVQILVNQHRLLPGRRWAIVGGGPERQEVAADLQHAGAEVAVVADSAAGDAIAVHGAAGVAAISVDGDRFAVDCVAVAAGRQPDVGLATMAGCALGYSAVLGGWAPARDAWGRTSVDRLLAAGNAAGVCAPQVAAAEGRLAGLAAAALVGRCDAGELDHALAAEADVLTGRERIEAGEYAQPYR